ncbi:MAG: CHASE4 domain-containing protein [Cyanobacteria bacterium P01_A01_bin.37]
MTFQWQPFSNLQAKVLSAVSGTFLVLFLGQLGVARSIIVRGYIDLETEQAETNAERLERAFREDLDAVKAVVIDWAFWDDTYEFVQTEDSAYVESNITPESFAIHSLNLIGIFDRDKNLVYGRVFDLETEEVSEIPPELLATLQQHPQLLHRSIEDTELAGLLQLGQELMVVASHTILTSEGQGPGQGSLLMGQYFGDTQLNSLSETTRLSVDGFLFDTDDLPNDVRAIAPNLIAPSKNLAIQTLSEEKIASYALIPDLSGEPALILKSSGDRDIYEKGRISLRYYFWSSFVIGGGFCVLILLLLRHLVLARLWILSQQVSHLGETRQDLVQISLPGNDELTQLANTINWAVHQLHQRTSELKVAKQIAESSKESADAANRAKSTFLANMSHELRTPLNAILGFAQILGRDRTLTPQQREHTNIINYSGEHLLSLINDVLDMSKIEAGHIELNPRSFNLPYLLETLTDMLHLNAEEKHISLILECADDVPQYVYGDSRKLHQTLINLLNNAIKFTTHGYVKLTVVRLDDAHPAQSTPQAIHLQFSIQDTGVGIAPEELSFLFEPFSQTHSGRQSQQGTGLGLPISQKFVELMGGNLTVTSQLGQGTIFSFDSWMEIRDSADADRESQSPQRTIVGLESGQPTYRILVVDDRPVNRKLLIELLKPIGFELREAENGQMAIEQWEIWQPHLIWMDMRMPVIDGYEATQQIKARLKGQATIIIALTASTLEEEKAIVLSAGCDDFVRKPFQQSTIFSKIAEHLGVRYHYDVEENVQESSVTNEQTCDSSIESMLATMPLDWLQRLHQATIQLKGQDIITLLGDIPQEYSDCQDAIKAKVDNFDFDQILTFIDPVLNAPHRDVPSAQIEGGKQLSPSQKE